MKPCHAPDARSMLPRLERVVARPDVHGASKTIEGLPGRTGQQ